MTLESFRMDFIFPFKKVTFRIIPGTGNDVFPWPSCNQWVVSLIQADHCVISCAIKNYMLLNIYNEKSNIQHLTCMSLHTSSKSIAACVAPLPLKFTFPFQLLHLWPRNDGSARSIVTQIRFPYVHCFPGFSYPFTCWRFTCVFIFI